MLCPGEVQKNDNVSKLYKFFLLKNILPGKEVFDEFGLFLCCKKWRVFID